MTQVAGQMYHILYTMCSTGIRLWEILSTSVREGYHEAFGGAAGHTNGCLRLDNATWPREVAEPMEGSS